MKRTDIKQKDVFISWTGQDRELKNKICDYLSGRDICCLEADEGCSGDFGQWSREAVSACTVFLLIFTEHTLDSEYVPVELAEYTKLDGFENRIVPVCESMELYNALPHGIPEYGSAVILDGKDADEKHLKDIFHKVSTLIVNRLDRVYREAVKPDYMRLIPLLGAKNFADREYDYSKLYIPRRLLREQKEVKFSGLFKKEITFICGAAGSGKTRYIEQLRAKANEDTLAMVLSCASLSQSEGDLVNDMYREFLAACKNRSFFTEADFSALIKNRRLMLIFDGMDEISTVDGTRRFLGKVERFCKSGGADASFIFTSRSMKDADLIAFDGRAVARHTLEELSGSEIEELCRNLFSLFGSAGKVQDFYKRIEPLDTQIKSNPLMLSQLAIVYEDSGEIPDTVVGIYDAVSKITLALDRGREIAEIPPEYRNMVTYDIEKILCAFAAEKYTLASRGKNVEARKILARILREKYGDADGRAEFLFEYLHSRAILTNGDFGHKTFLEYYTAVYFYERSFDDYDELCNTDAVSELFSHYRDAYWADVINMFLAKADVIIDKENTKELYRFILSQGIDEYTLLVESACSLSQNRDEALTSVLSDMLVRSATREVPPYGPLFWYVPHYNLYEQLVSALAALEDTTYLAEATALVRDVCFMFGGFNRVCEVLKNADGEKLFNRASDRLTHVRGALCQLFYLGKTDCKDGGDIYPRCFNVGEAKSFAESGCGVLGEMDTPFYDTLSLYSHISYNEFCGEHIGFISCSGEAEITEAALAGKSTSKVIGVAFTPTDSTVFCPVNFNASNVRLSYIPENAIPDYKMHAGSLCKGLLSGFSEISEKKMYHHGSVSIPSEVTEIKIKNGLNIKEIRLPSGLETVSAGAFRGLSGLRLVHFPDSLCEIGESAFKGCRCLESVCLPKQTQKIGKDAFFNCASLKKAEIPDGVSVIEDSCFAGCILLSEVKLPCGVVRIGNEAFAGSAIEEMVLCGSVREIGDEAFKECEKLSRVLLQDGTEIIGDCAFMGCKALEQIIIPKTVRAIGEGAFFADTEVIREDCMQMYTVSLDGVTEIPDYAFAGHGEISEIEIPDGVRSIGYGAFFACKSLREIKLPDSVREIKKDAFSECTSLLSVTLPKHLDVISDKVFSGCKSLENITVPSGACSIGMGAFSSCESLQEINLPDTVTEIGSGAFLGCTSLSEITLPPELEAVEEYTFYDCKSLAKVTLGKKVKVILGFAFYDCPSLAELQIPAGAKTDNDAFDPRTRLIFEDEEADLLTLSRLYDDEEYEYAGSRMRRLVLEEGIQEIYPGAFSRCPNLESVIFPSTLEKIDYCAFEECSSLGELCIPEGVHEVGDRAFYYCSGIKTAVLPESITNLGVGVFAFCSSLESVAMPKNYDGDIVGTFSYCKSLKEIEIPRGVRKIDFQAFCGCWSLSRVILPDSLKLIGGASFAECKALREIRLPSGLLEIGASSFRKCENLKGISIPASVKAIGNSAFEECPSLESIEISYSFEGDIERIFGEIDRKIIRFV